MSLLPHAECYSYSYIPNCLVQQLCDLHDSDYLHKSQVLAHCLLHNIHAVLKGVMICIIGLHAVILRQFHGAASVCKVIFGVSDFCSTSTFLSSHAYWSNLLRVILAGSY